MTCLVDYRYIAIMLSRVIKHSLRKAFSTSNITATRSSSSLNLAERAGVTDIDASSTSELSDLKQIAQGECKHLTYYANEYCFFHPARKRNSTTSSRSTSKASTTRELSSFRASLTAQITPNWGNCSCSAQPTISATYCWVFPHTQPSELL